MVTNDVQSTGEISQRTHSNGVTLKFSGKIYSATV
jgi:hypothetical protein